MFFLPPFFQRNRLSLQPAFWCVAMGLACFAVGHAWAQESSEELAFFERKIRPVLIEHCYECHESSSDQLKGGLAVDTRAGLAKGGDSGPAVVPGSVEDSLLLSALRYDSFEMPPSGALPEAVIADFEKWIQDGAVDPRNNESGTPDVKPIDIESGRKHWAYQPLDRPEIPTVHEDSWATGNIDRFILAKLKEKKLEPATDAEKTVLIRRLYFDLIGLPPTATDIDSFLADGSSEAYENLVERLLDSPQFGERWGRHWLDVVRYAESVTLRGFILNEAWRYRDYVIEAFNSDRPLDQFLMEQLAGDLLSADSVEERQKQLIATTFLMMGNANLEDQNKPKLEMDYVDEQLDVISRGMLGQTVTCARCHDHKFDPIPTRDYYALAGILKNATTLNHANISKWVEVPLPLEPDAQQKLDEFDLAVKQLTTEIKSLKQKLNDQGANSSNIVDRIVATDELKGIVVDDEDAEKLGEWQHSTHHKHYVNRGYSHDQNQAKGQKSLRYVPLLPHDGLYEVRFSYQWGDSRAKNVPVTIFGADGETTVSVDETQPPNLEDRFVSLGVHRFEVAKQAYVEVTTTNTRGFVIADAVQFVPVEESEAKESLANQKASDTEVAAEMKRKLERELSELEAELADVRKTAPDRPMTMSLLDHNKPQDLPIHIRGDVGNLGEVVPRGVLRVATLGEGPSMPADQSGRLELARWIVARDNPLTARVMVNRIWYWLVGTGLVRTLDNFGTTGQSPSHPELLDYLAMQLMEQNWSAKSLIREIVLSRFYRLASEAEPTVQQQDPENRWLTHMNRRRLDAEMIRDAMLVCSNELDDSMGGQTFPETLSNDYDFTFAQPRRSVYVPVFRNSLPEIFELFDFANVSMVTGKRDVSTVAPQALYFMNHPFPQGRAEVTAKRFLKEDFGDDTACLKEVFLAVVGRTPSDEELQVCLSFLQESDEIHDEERLRTWTELIKILFSTVDFRYLR
jgi:hypothetical protein